LKDWTKTGEFEATVKDDTVWECPDLFPLSLGDVRKWILVVNRNPGGF